jgi:hypothetical protein
MGVASCRRTFLCLILRVRFVLSRFSVRDWSPCRASRIGSCASWVFDPRSGSAQPGPALRAPGAHTLPMRPLLSLSLSFGSPAQQPPSPASTSLSPWCPRNWRRRSPEFGPRGELPCPRRRSRPPPARGGPRPSPCSPACGPRPLPCPRRCGPAPLPARTARGPCPAPARGGAAPGAARPGAAPGAVPCPGAAARPPTRRPRPLARPQPLRAASRPSAWLVWPRTSPVYP